MADMKIVRCISCDGYGWEDDEGDVRDCAWCDGTGYTYRDSDGIDHPIPAEDYGKIADELEQLEMQRMRELGYTGTAKNPEDQEIRKQNQSPDEA
ncbi:MAG: hypothetical protein D6737_17460 [Chloroflexi bacterium]|nr:MAG: hypothetical protein D6737_17460 [Chloroflexota bacterium]